VCHHIAAGFFSSLGSEMFAHSSVTGNGRTVCVVEMYEGHLESKERFAIQKYLLIIGKKKNMQVLSHTFTYFYT
jgi:hypothetical protein